ncbi:MAG: cobalt transporter CbiM [Acidobacteriota bacterium]|nr:cobalt transporter CbiM [Acidobacteriota bacterium]
MHIPDGYLSPVTCAALYALSAPFWAIALRRVKRLLNTRFVPLLSVFAAFSFVIMMFNIPLPGGTTGHAAGIGIATIVLGVWGSILAISVALLIQALFFGDGGILAFAANSFNMAIIGSFVAAAVYRIVANRAPITSPRRVVAAGLAGYAAMNAAAFVAAIEFGIQPMLFQDASGAPLYAPYPLSIAVPAMMIGHLTVAGLAEAIVTAGVVAYIQKTDSSLLRLTAPDAPGAETGQKSGWRATKPLWIGLAALMILTPLGLLAAGTAWGEWAPEDFNDASAREEIAAASLNQAPPSAPPEGLEKLASFWTAPIPDYAPPFMNSPQFGYVLSAMFGTGLIIAFFLLVGWILQKFGRNRADETISASETGNN